MGVAPQAGGGAGVRTSTYAALAAPRAATTLFPVHRGRLTCALLISAALALWPAAASAVPFGLPLGTAPFTGSPGNPYDCNVVYEPFVGPTPMPGATGSCIWIHVPTPADVQAFGNRNISLEPPGTGTVTQVRVAVGPVTGRMQVVVMRALYENTTTPGRPNDACCFPVAASQPFTPGANTISTISVNLPVKEDATPPPEDITTIADFDTLGLAVLEPGVPVPMYYTGNTSDPADFVWNSSQPSTVTPGFTTDAGGFFVAMSGDWTAASTGGGGAGGPAGAGGGAVPLDFGNRMSRVRNGNANVALRCAGNVTCIGQLLLQSAAAGGAQLIKARDAAGKRPTTYGKASFRISAHGRKTLVVRLSSGGKKLLAKHRSVKVWANVKLSTGSVKNYAVRITLHR
jgi:hypothetical protein